MNVVSRPRKPVDDDRGTVRSCVDEVAASLGRLSHALSRDGCAHNLDDLRALDLDAAAQAVHPAEAEACVTVGHGRAVNALEHERERPGEREIDERKGEDAPGDDVDRVPNRAALRLAGGSVLLTPAGSTASSP